MEPGDAAFWRPRRELFAREHRHDLVAEAAVQRVQEQFSRLRVAFPGILPVERHRDGGGPARAGDPAEQVAGGFPGVASRVAESDAIAEIAVAEKHGHLA